jgi:hypothetical protein
MLRICKASRATVLQAYLEPERRQNALRQPDACVVKRSSYTFGLPQQNDDDDDTRWNLSAFGAVEQRREVRREVPRDRVGNLCAKRRNRNRKTICVRTCVRRRRRQVKYNQITQSKWRKNTARKIDTIPGRYRP